MQQSGGLTIQLFGQANASVDGTPVRFAKRTLTLTMLALLILRRGRPVARTFLAFTLFPDSSEELALQELRRYLYLAGKSLPAFADEPWLLADAETVRWNESASATVDVIEFQRLASSPETYAQAAELYTGDLLEDLYDDWIVTERERLRTLHLQIVESLVERHRAAREHALALAYAHRLLTLDPFREDVLRKIMSIRYAAGDVPGALAEFDRFAQRLTAEMAVAPMAETVAIRDAILAGRPLIGSVDRVSHDHRGSLAVRGHTLPFVGREDELALLQARLDRAARGFGNCVFIGGEAGVGKTRLVGELARLVEAQGGRVYSGGTSSPESSPYQSIVEAVRAALPVMLADRTSGANLAMLRRVLPELERHGLPDVAALSPEREATRLFGAFATAFEALARTRPLLIVFEDLHWASLSTLDALATICRRIDRSRILIVATYREEESRPAHPLRRLLNSLGIEQRMADVHVRRFDRRDVQNALSRANIAAGDDLVDRLYTMSEGNALFLTEALADLTRDGTLRAAEGAHAEIPVAGIDRIVEMRCDGLSDAARTVAEIAATCGEGCTIDLVADVAGYSAAETIDAFNELLDRRLVREAGQRKQYDFVFSHNLIGSAIYRHIEQQTRLRRHARIAHVIERRGEIGPGEARELARHYAAAHMSSTAARWYCRAAADAAVLYAHDDARTFATHAIELTDEPATEREALFVREEANARLARREDQWSDLERLDRLVEGPELRYRVLRRKVTFLRFQDDREREAAAIRALQEHAHNAHNTHWQAAATIAEANLCLATGQFAEAKKRAAEALAQLGPDGAVDARIDALAASIEAHVSLGEFAAADRMIGELLTSAKESGDRSAECEVLLRRVSLAMLQQQFERAAELSRELLLRYRAMGDRIGEARALSNIATACTRLSRWAEARSANLDAASMCEGIGDIWGMARAKMNLGMLLGRCGDLDAARELLASARELHVRLGDRRAIAASLVNEGFIALWQGELADAKRLSSEAVHEARTMDHAPYIATALANLGAAERDLGELDSAIEHMKEGLALQVGLNRMADGVSDLADLALAHAMNGDAPAALEASERVLEVDGSWSDAAIFPPYPLWAVACVLHWAGDARAAATLESAWHVARAFEDSIDSPDLREKFRALPFMTAIERVRAGGEWPLVRPPHAQVIHSEDGRTTAGSR